jgi:hypothetical protein
MDPRFDPSFGPVAADLAAVGSVAAGLDDGECPAVRQRFLTRQVYKTRFLANPPPADGRLRSWAGGFDFSLWPKERRGRLHLGKQARLSKL